MDYVLIEGLTAKKIYISSCYFYLYMGILADRENTGVPMPYPVLAAKVAKKAYRELAVNLKQLSCFRFPNWPTSFGCRSTEIFADHCSLEGK